MAALPGVSEADGIADPEIVRPRYVVLEHSGGLKKTKTWRKNAFARHVLEKTKPADAAFTFKKSILVRWERGKKNKS